MKIIKATVLLSVGMDNVILDTDLPSSIPQVTPTPLQVLFYCSRDKGAAYVQANFPDVPIAVINRPNYDGSTPNP